jgi:type I restriction-modification system DNA methylase subunit
MPNHSPQITQKLWNYCNVLRDDGMSYGDYVEQLTDLLFLKMAMSGRSRRLTRQVLFRSVQLGDFDQERR